MVQTITVRTTHQGLFAITDKVNLVMGESDLEEGLCTLFVQHTSASLLIQENYDPSAQRGLETWMNRLVPENDPLYTHTLEGPDDMPAHIKSVLTATSISIPFQAGRLALGTWQGIYLWEHRHQGSSRTVVVHLSH